ncbi:hypothetical protein HZA97_06275 [Candidatus Woesearchaeota archaeon]|nr:hypothetical protein [Candidatus Woesearchaeota archaeon]
MSKKEVKKKSEDQKGVESRQKELIDELKRVKTHLIEETEVKKSLMNSFLDQWERNFHQLQFVKQEIQALIRNTQNMIHEDLQALHKKENELESNTFAKVKTHTHTNPKEYKEHVKEIKKTLEKQVEKDKKENKKEKTKPTLQKNQTIEETFKKIEELIRSKDVKTANELIKKAELEVKKLKDENKKKILIYELQDLKTSVKLAEIL